MDSCEKEFESAGQEARRLAIALKRFISSPAVTGLASADVRRH